MQTRRRPRWRATQFLKLLNFLVFLSLWHWVRGASRKMLFLFLLFYFCWFYKVKLLIWERLPFGLLMIKIIFNKKTSHIAQNTHKQLITPSFSTLNSHLIAQHHAWYSCIKRSELTRPYLTYLTFPHTLNTTKMPYLCWLVINKRQQNGNVHLY